MKGFIFTCYFSFVLSNDHHSRSSKVYWQMDIRQEGEQRCEHGRFFETTHGISHFEHSFNPFLPDTPMGDRVFKIHNKVDASCVRFVPKGFNVQSTRSASAGVQTTETKSISSMTTMEKSMVSGSLGGSYDGIGGSVSASHTHATTRSHSESTRKRYFFTWIENFDTRISKMKTDTPPLDRNFQQELNKMASDTLVTHKRHKLMFKFIRRYPYFLQSAQLGSRETEVRIVNDATLSRLKQEDSSFSAREEINILFVKLTSSQSGSETMSNKEQQILENSSSHRTVIGAKPDRQLLSFPKALYPGLGSPVFTSICEAFPQENTFNKVRKMCRGIFQSTAVCFAIYPDITLKSEFELESMKRLVASSRVHERCKSTLPPLFNLRLEHRHWDGAVWDPRSETLHECVERMDRKGGESFSFVNDKCFICYPTTAKTKQALDAYTESDCDTARRLQVYGRTTTVTMVQKADHTFGCHLNRTRRFHAMGQKLRPCFRTVPCKPFELCMTGFATAAKWQHKHYDSSYWYEKYATFLPDIFLPWGSIPVGAELGTLDEPRVRSVQYGCDAVSQDARKAWKEIAKGLGSEDHKKIVDWDFLDRNRQIAAHCAKDCINDIDCDMFTTEFYPDFRGTGINANGNYDPDKDTDPLTVQSCNQRENPNWVKDSPYPAEISTLLGKDLSVFRCRFFPGSALLYFQYEPHTDLIEGEMALPGDMALPFRRSLITVPKLVPGLAQGEMAADPEPSPEPEFTTREPSSRPVSDPEPTPEPESESESLSRPRGPGVTEDDIIDFAGRLQVRLARERRERERVERERVERERHEREHQEERERIERERARLVREHLERQPVSFPEPDTESEPKWTGNIRSTYGGHVAKERAKIRHLERERRERERLEREHLASGNLSGSRHEEILVRECVEQVTTTEVPTTTTWHSYNTWPDGDYKYPDDASKRQAYYDAHQERVYLERQERERQHVERECRERIRRMLEEDAQTNELVSNFNFSL